MDSALKPTDCVYAAGLPRYLSNDQLRGTSPLVDALENASDSAAESSDCRVDAGDEGILDTIVSVAEEPVRQVFVRLWKYSAATVSFELYGICALISIRNLLG